MARPADPNARQALLNAARAEFAKKGLKGARIEDITAACDLSKGSFYLHFESKEALFRELVDELFGEVVQIAEERFPKLQAFVEKEGMPTAADVEQHTERYERMVALEVDDDCRILELLWRMRDVVDVLMSGSQGTPFEGLVWEMAEREADRVAESFEKLQGTGACRTDVPPGIFGSLIVGTYLLVAKQMSRATQKPDLRAWALAIHRLVREGSTPRTGAAGGPLFPEPDPRRKP